MNSSTSLIDFLFIKHWEWTIGLFSTLFLRLMYINAIKYRDCIGIYRPEIYSELDVDKQLLIQALIKTYKMTVNNRFFIGLVSLPMQIVIYYLIKNLKGIHSLDLNKTLRQCDGNVIIIPMDDPFMDFYYDNEKRIKLTSKIFKIMYYFIHWSMDKSIWLRK